MRGLVVLAAVLTCACESAPQLATAGLSLRALPSCPVQAEGMLRLRAAGDFETRQVEVSSERTATVDSFPTDTRWLSIEVDTAEGVAGALVAIGDDDLVRGARMLPLDEACPLGDPLVAAPEGAALAVLDDGGLLIAGGKDLDGEASEIAALLPAGALLGRQLEGGMLQRRAGATASATGTHVIVAGGAPDDGPGHETYEVYDVESGSFDSTLAARLDTARRDHGAALLPDGSVLLVGGRQEEDGPVLSSAERIVGPGSNGRAVGALTVGRAAAQVMVLDSGLVLVVGGVDGDGNPVGVIERYDPDSERFESIGSLLDPLPLQALAPLEGDRVAWLSCEDEGACRLTILRASADGAPAVARFGQARSAELGLEDLEQVRMVGLPDGTLVVSARAVGGSRMLRIDPGRATGEPIDTTRVADRLRVLSDGTTVALDAFGGSLYRHSTDSALHDPRAQGLALGSAESLQERDGRVIAETTGARVDLAPARFADVRVELELEGEGRMLLEPASASPIQIELETDEVALGGCRVEREPDRPLRVTRRGETVAIAAGDEEQECLADGLVGHIGIAFVLDAGAELALPEVTRL